MSDYIPLEIQIEIIKRAPDVKSLIRFRAVSKQWKSFIDSSEFIAGYRARKTHPHTLFLMYSYNHETKYVSVNNDTLAQQQDLASNVSVLMKRCDDLVVVGYSRGLLCLYAFDIGGLVLWNPMIRRSVGIIGRGFRLVFGFAVCSVTNEPTIVDISFPWKVLIFTLSSKKWTEVQCSQPRESFDLHEGSQAVIGSRIYRVAREKIYLPNGCFTIHRIILSFDLIAKEFRAIDLPSMITNPIPVPVRFLVSKLKGSLYVILPSYLSCSDVKVWKMEPDCSFTQQLTINTPDSNIQSIVGFRKNGELLVQTQERGGKSRYYGDARESALGIYDPRSKNINNLGFSGGSGSFSISSYKETLHLLDHSDSCMYPEII